MLVTVLTAAAALAESAINVNGGPLSVTFAGEVGLVKVLSHSITIGEAAEGNTTFNYVNTGGQEILFPISRLTAELGFSNRHAVILLYQPLVVETQVRLDEDETIDGVLFPADEGINITYSFPFYRVSYLFNFLPQDHIELAAGVSLQLRNASLGFESTNGESIVVTQDLGIVPILKLRGEYVFVDAAVPGAFVGLEADGFYASSAFFNGAEYEFEGSVFDVSLRAGFEPMPGMEIFFNLRGFGGGSSGTRGDAREFATQSRDGFTETSLNAISATIGARLK